MSGEITYYTITLASKNNEDFGIKEITKKRGANKELSLNVDTGDIDLNINSKLLNGIDFEDILKEFKCKANPDDEECFGVSPESIKDENGNDGLEYKDALEEPAKVNEPVNVINQQEGKNDQSVEDTQKQSGGRRLRFSKKKSSRYNKNKSFKKISKK